MDYNFEWDEVKAATNVQKHGISFEEVITIFNDPNAITIFDAAHSDAEERFVDIGYSIAGTLLVVVYTERGANIRIISGREATTTERRQYERRRN